MSIVHIINVHYVQVSEKVLRKFISTKMLLSTKLLSTKYDNPIINIYELYSATSIIPLNKHGKKDKFELSLQIV